MKAGFAKAVITPPLGTSMLGFGDRDRRGGCQEIHDDLFMCALYLEHEGREVVILAFDLIFFSRAIANRYWGAIGRRFGFAPHQVLMNTSHTHSGPDTACWAWRGYTGTPDPPYLDELEYCLLDTIARARAGAREATLRAGATRSTLPMSRRKPDGQGGVEWAPYPAGRVCAALPLCLIEDRAGEPICLLFSVSCHPTMIGTFEVSAEFPGVATKRLDAHFGAEVSMFLQGTAGDAKASVQAHATGRFSKEDMTWDNVEAAGALVADEVLHGLEAGLQEVEPQFATALVEMEWPMQPLPSIADYDALLADGSTRELIRLWAQRQRALLERERLLPTKVPISAHGVQLGHGLRLVGIEGEVVGDLGNQILSFYDEGVTFPLGYTDGTQLYLVTSAQIDEGGYEVESYTEYGFPAPLAKGMEAVLQQTLTQLREQGVG